MESNGAYKLWQRNFMHQFRTIFQDNLSIVASPDNDAKYFRLSRNLLELGTRSAQRWFKIIYPTFFSSHIRGFFVFSSSLTSKLLFKINIIIFLVLSDWWNFVPAHRRIGGVIHYFVFFFVFCIRSLFTFSMFLFTSHHINGGRETVCLAHRGIGGPGRGGLENLTATRATPARWTTSDAGIRTFRSYIFPTTPYAGIMRNSWLKGMECELVIRSQIVMELWSKSWYLVFVKSHMMKGLIGVQIDVRFLAALQLHTYVPSSRTE